MYAPNYWEKARSEHNSYETSIIFSGVYLILSLRPGTNTNLSICLNRIKAKIDPAYFEPFEPILKSGKAYANSRALDKELARHEDSENAIPSGNAFDFAELHYKRSGDELLKTLNKEMNLHIGEKFDFYANGKKSSNTSDTLQTKSPPVGDLGGCLFSFFKVPVRNTIPHKNVSLVQVYKYIVSEYAKNRTEKLRIITDPKQARQYKATNFDYCTFSGMFTTRNDKALVNHSGLLCIDFDHLQNVDMLRNQLLQDEYFETQLLFVSPSGDGLKWIISIDAAKASHSDFFAAVANYILQTYKVEVDKSGRDISRACFLPYDPQAYINPLYKPSTL